MALQILALRYISLSEIQKFLPEVDSSWYTNRTEEFNNILFELGLDLNTPYEYQESIQHRNMLGEIVTCARIVGNERTDQEWVISGYASQAAIDKSKNNKILTDLYRLKGEVDLQD